MTGESPAAELDALLRHPGLHGRWPGGFTTDDVLADLTALGRVRVEVHDVTDGAAAFVCRLALREEGVGAVRGHGHTLTAAALRCLLEAEAELAAEVARGLDELGELLGGR